MAPGGVHSGVKKRHSSASALANDTGPPMSTGAPQSCCSPSAWSPGRTVAGSAAGAGERAILPGHVRTRTVGGIRDGRCGVAVRSPRSGIPSTGRPVISWGDGPSSASGFPLRCQGGWLTPWTPPSSSLRYGAASNEPRPPSKGRPLAMRSAAAHQRINRSSASLPRLDATPSLRPLLGVGR
jgi:hypothetical protein